MTSFAYIRILQLKKTSAHLIAKVVRAMAVKCITDILKKGLIWNERTKGVTLRNIEQSSSCSQTFVLARDFGEVQKQLDDTVLLLQGHDAAIRMEH